MYKSLSIIAVALIFCGGAIAAEGDVGPVQIERLGIISTATGGHIAGNMEVRIKNGFTPPPGVNCPDHNYITTRKSTDPDRAMFFMLLKAQTTPQPIRLRITDDPALQAYSGRCSIVIVDLQ